MPQVHEVFDAEERAIYYYEEEGESWGGEGVTVTTAIMNPYEYHYEYHYDRHNSST